MFSLVGLGPWAIGNPGVHLVIGILQVLQDFRGNENRVRCASLHVSFFLQFADQDVPMLEDVDPMVWAICCLDSPLDPITILTTTPRLKRHCHAWTSLDTAVLLVLKGKGPREYSISSCPRSGGVFSRCFLWISWALSASLRKPYRSALHTNVAA